MKRYAIQELEQWKGRSDRKPLLLLGARQVGKTWLMQEFGRVGYRNTAYVRFDTKPQIREIFEQGADIPRLLATIQYEVGFRPEPGETLIVFDEIQECPAALTSLKYFCEEAPEYHVIAAGSRLGIRSTWGSGFPVGKVDFMRLYPMCFHGISGGHRVRAAGGAAARGRHGHGDRLPRRFGGTAKSIIAAGEMYYQWNFSCKLGEATRHLTPIQTDLQKVYNIFGPSTWPVSGKVETSVAANQQSTAILPWEDALNTMTRLWLCDDNNNENRLGWDCNSSGNYHAMHETAARLTRGIFCSYQYPYGNYTKTLDDNQFEDDFLRDSYSEGYISTDIYRLPALVSEGGYSMQMTEYGKNENPWDIINDIYNALEPAYLSSEYHENSNIYKKPQKRLICLDAADALCVIPRIMGFPQGLALQFTWNVDNNNIGSHIPRNWHAFCVMDALVYDATPNRFQKEDGLILVETEDCTVEKWRKDRTGEAGTAEEGYRSGNWDYYHRPDDAPIMLQSPLIYTYSI